MQDIAFSFINKVNAHDIDGIVSLMTPDHRFIDSLGNVVRGRDSMRKGWEDYFKMVPGYKIEIEKSFADGNTVILIGRASGTYSPDGKVHPEYAWSTPAVWLAKVDNGLISEWRIYADNEPIRRHMRDASA